MNYSYFTSNSKRESVIMSSKKNQFHRIWIHLLHKVLVLQQAIMPKIHVEPQKYFTIHIYWLKFYGLWYNDYSIRTLNYWKCLLWGIWILWITCVFPSVGEIIYLTSNTDDVGKIAEGLYLFLSEFFTYIKLAVFWMKKQTVIEILNMANSEQFKPSEPEHIIFLEKTIKTARFIVTCYIVVCVFAVSVAIIMPATENFEILPTNVVYPYFDTYKYPAYIIVYINHIYYKPSTCIIDAIMDTILAAFVQSVIGQVDILAFDMKNMKEVALRRFKLNKKQKNKEIPNDLNYFTRQVLTDCIIRHVHILRYVAKIEKAFSMNSAVQLFLSASVLCLVGVRILSIDEPTKHPLQIIWTIVYLTCMLIEVFILCWFGNELIWKSGKLQDAAFNGSWPDMNKECGRFVKLFMERTKRPMKLTAGKIFPLSLGTYTSLIKWSYNAFAVMRSMKP